MFKRLPIKYKLIFLGVFTSFIALFLGLSGFILYNWWDFKKGMIRELKTLSQIMAYNSAAPLMFNDKESAEEVLSALKVKKHILTAVIYTPQGKLFAKYGKGECPFSQKPYSRISENSICLLQDIVYQGERVGSICIKATLSELYQNLKRYLLIGLLVLGVSLIASVILSSYLQRLISVPILKIVETANLISRKKDYSVRVKLEASEDELGILVNSFNAMLAEIENRDANLEYLVAQRTRELEEAVERLKELDRMKSDFLSNVSHELRTPLTSVRGFASVIKKQFEKYIIPHLSLEEKKVKRAVEKIKENLEIIISESKRLTNLINDVLDLAKIESGKIEWKREEVNMKEVMEEVAKAVRPLAEEKGLEIKGEVEGEDFVVIGDRERLIQVATNIFSNAIKFTDKGRITYRVKDLGEEVRCEIEDTGCGIPEDMLESIFEKFKQVGDTLTEKPQGTGLGLPICREIINHHGGKIWAESELGKGSKFIFIIPKKIDNLGE